MTFLVRVVRGGEITLELHPPSLLLRGEAMPRGLTSIILFTKFFLSSVNELSLFLLLRTKILLLRGVQAFLFWLWFGGGGRGYRYVILFYR